MFADKGDEVSSALFLYSRADKVVQGKHPVRLDAVQPQYSIHRVLVYKYSFY